MYGLLQGLPRLMLGQQGKMLSMMQGMPVILRMLPVAKTCCPENMSLFSVKKCISMIFRVFLQHFTV
jgi:hypothetical protein